MTSSAYGFAHLFSGLMLVASFALLYQGRMLAVLRIFAIQAIMLALAVSWQAYIQERPHLLITAVLALLIKGIGIPYKLRSMIYELGVHRTVEKVVGVGLTMLAGLALVALSLSVMLKATSGVPSFAREELAIALAIVLLGILMMITRRNAITQIIGFMSIENGLILGATGASGMPFVVEISVAFSVLVSLFVFAMVTFGIRERFDTVDVDQIDKARGGQA